MIYFEYWNHQYGIILECNVTYSERTYHDILALKGSRNIRIVNVDPVKIYPWEFNE
jgi:hypothetical protein